MNSSPNRILIAGLAVFSCGLLVACQPTRTPAPEPGEADQTIVAPASAARYRLDSSQTSLDILVYRAGSLASLGHNHVVSAGSINALIYITEPLDSSVFQLTIPVNDLLVDEAQARSRYGNDFAAPVDTDAISGTRENMLGPRQLDGANWPDIVIRSRSLKQVSDTSWLMGVAVTLRDYTHELEVPVTLTSLSGRFAAVAEFSVSQSDLGLTPFSVMLGALQVRDQLDIRIRLSATRSE